MGQRYSKKPYMYVKLFVVCLIAAFIFPLWISHKKYHYEYSWMRQPQRNWPQTIFVLRLGSLALTDVVNFQLQQLPPLDSWLNTSPNFSGTKGVGLLG